MNRTNLHAKYKNMITNPYAPVPKLNRVQIRAGRKKLNKMHGLEFGYELMQRDPYSVNDDSGVSGVN